jgi:four helix bundle protein
MAYFKFQKLEVWHLAMDFAEIIVKEARSFPKTELYNLTSQMSRAVDSIALNIAEGSIGQTGPEFKRFLSYAIRSAAETATCLIKAKRRGYINEEKFDVYFKECFKITNKLSALKNSIK